MEYPPIPKEKLARQKTSFFGSDYCGKRATGIKLASEIVYHHSLHLLAEVALHIKKFTLGATEEHVLLNKGNRSAIKEGKKFPPIGSFSIGNDELGENEGESAHHEAETQKGEKEAAQRVAESLKSQKLPIRGESS
jgi:hypothetical protein